VNIPPDRPRPVVDPSRHPFRSALPLAPRGRGVFYEVSSAIGSAAQVVPKAYL
jgi:hypothetical protein